MNMKSSIKAFVLLFYLLGLCSLLSCSPVIKVEAPDKPITINLNIKIQHEIRVKVDKDLNGVFSNNKGLF